MAGRGGRLADLFDYLAERGADAPPATQAQIAQAVFGEVQNDADDATVRVYMHRLRKKLDDHYRDHPPAPGQPMLDLPAGIYALRLVGAGDGAPASAPGALPPPTRALPPRSWLALGALALAVLLALAFVAGGWQRGGAGGEGNAVWRPLASSQRPVLLVLGDYYLFGELDPITPENSRLIRDFRINSAEDLLRLQGSEPDRYDNAEDVGLNYLPFQSAYALSTVMPLLRAQGHSVEVIPASQFTVDMLATNDVVYVGLLSGMGLLEDITFADSSLRVGESYDEVYDKRSDRRWISDEAMRLAAPVFYRDYAYVSRFAAPGGAQVTVIASERVTGLRGIGPIVTAATLPDELDEAAAGEGFEALYQFTGQQGADLSERLVLVRPAVEAGERLGFCRVIWRKKSIPICVRSTTRCTI